GIEPFASADGEDAAAADDEIGGLVAPGDGEPPGKYRGHAGPKPYSSARGDSDPVRARRGAPAEGRAPRRAAHPGRDGRDGRAQFRPLATRHRAQPERGRGASRVVASERVAATRGEPH